MTSRLDRVRADSIRTGDQFLHEDGRVAWTAVADAQVGYMPHSHLRAQSVAVDVRHHPDGGLDTRWFTLDMTWPARMVRRAEEGTPAA